MFSYFSFPVMFFLTSIEAMSPFPFLRSSLLETGLPDLGCCLLHQKLQMLNCCIERKKIRENRETRQPRLRSEDERESSSDDEEFFECYDKTLSSTDVTSDAERPSSSTRERERPLSSVSSGSADGVFKDTVSQQPDGRLRRCGDLRLLKSEQPLYIPVTQEPTPMTEDLLEEHAEVLVQLGTDAQGTELRAKMQSACLLSDMEAFKAANPTCCLEDFVRWYSPRDWIQEDDEGKKGHLSTRMMLPGNIWTDVWETANAVPSRRQRRLFDDTREAEKVLHWLASLTVGQLVTHLMPVILHAALLTAANAVGENDSDSVEAIAQRISKMLRAPKVDVKRYEEIARLISGLEVTTARITSLRTKLSTPEGVPEIEKLILELLQQDEVQLVGAGRAPAGQAVVKLFTQAQKSLNMLIDADSSDEDIANSDDGSTMSKTHPAISEFPKPTAREFILRATVPRPAPYSTPTPQRLFCVLQSDETRLAGAFSQDTTFQ
uniref:Rab3 GTPase-activating protein catalytic subunit n=1 Tax=Strigamia maritima TaxID=126957 RepID=T1J5I1_STRMM